MPRIKIQLQDGIKRVVTLDTDATVGAQLGTNLYLPSGAVANPTTFLQWLGTTVTPSSSNSGGSSGPSLSSILTTKGDLATRDTQVQRLGIGTSGQLLRASAGGLPEWATIDIPVGANPTAQVGLTAIDGTAITFLRSDGAPALDQGIAPTWTGLHIFNNAVSVAGAPNEAATTGRVAIGVTASGSPMVLFNNEIASPDWRKWESYVFSDGSYLLEAIDDAVTVGKQALRFFRAGAAITAQQYGNSTDNPTHTFFGGIAINAPTGGNQGAGTLNATELYIQGVAVQTQLNAKQPLSSVLTAYAGGDTPSAFTLGIVDSTDAAAWRTAIGAGTSSFSGAWGSLSGVPTILTTLGALGNAAGALTNDGAGNLSWVVGSSTSGTYTPTGANITNTSGITALTGMYSRVGNIVTVSGTFTVTTTVVSNVSRVAVSLPIASALTAQTQLVGGIACSSVLGSIPLNGCTYGDATNDRAEIQFVAPASATAHTYSFWFQYEVI